MDTYTVQITRLSDGVTREHTHKRYGRSDEQIAYLWTDGNYECDCNRELFFEGSDLLDGNGFDCGSSRYAVRSPFFDDHATRGK